MIKHIFLDMDNTLLNSAGNLSTGNISTIRNCGVPVTLVTARPPMAMRTVIEQLELTDEQVAFNGGLIFKARGARYQKIFSKGIAFEKAAYILKTVQKKFPKTSANWFTIKDWYIGRRSSEIEREAAITHLNPRLMPLEQLEQLKEDMLYKIMLISPTNTETDVILNYLSGLHIQGVSITRSNSNYLELTNDCISKRNGIAHIQKNNRLAKSELAAFGDGENDIEMFKVVGTAVAMKNAAEMVKNYADFVTLSNDEDGVGYGIKKILMSEELSFHSGLQG
ncbi:Cof-type HAD-IIB family hydrolase [Liquorilactobacillus oeni]|uniref:HAD superfamily hydrolase n=1 Tax=Liquorilactobacillus oeni DSM 19972 TaxID=1423777 RepID=A0A0R1MEW1_9LACO|nr:Cof-type HAD-IIB family hydrolase [Liquorilactobacillus oeni]KRL04436.1 hypothetical protein FD46_GL001565 [Liquorilactobacillus oeni DSM 19972]